MKRNVAALLLALLVLLTGCSKQELGQMPLEELLEKTPVSMEEGHLFFTGKVTAASVMNRMISFYEVETEKSTFYQVEVTDDPFDCMPDRTLTVCILGSAESFGERNALQKDKEYLFDTSLWVQEDEAVLLLPTMDKGCWIQPGSCSCVTIRNTPIITATMQGWVRTFRITPFPLAPE